MDGDGNRFSEELQETASSLSKNVPLTQNLKIKLKENENITNYPTTTTIASTKIVELSRKLRDKNAELESWKTKYSKLEKKILEIQNNETEKVPPIKEINLSGLQSENEDQLKKIQDKLSATSFKLRELQNTNIHLKNELKLANKYLQQEVGDTIETLSNSSGWRGRAQIICDLQRKVQELKDKLNKNQKKISGGEEVTQKSENKLDTLTIENEDLKNTLNDQKKRNEVLRVRCKVLETEQSLSKSKIASLIAQIEGDENMMRNLTNQVTNQQTIANEALKQKEKCIKNLQQENEDLRIEISKQKCTVQNLNEKIEEMKNLTKKRNKSNGLTSTHDEKKKFEIDEKLVDRLEAEKSRLLELTEVQASKLLTERNAHLATQERLILERQKAAKLETSISKLELEYSAVRSGGSYFNLISNRSMEKKKNVSDLEDELELAKESIKALKKRLEIEQQERKMDFKEFSKILQIHN